MISTEAPYNLRRPLHPDDYRTVGERSSLVLSVGGIGLLALATNLWIIAAIILVITVVVIKMQQKSALGNAVRINARQFPALFEPVLMAAQRLGMHPPEVFVQQDPHMNAYAMGVGGRGTVVLQTGLLDAMKQNEILFVIGHELGHLAAGHTRMIAVRGVPNAGVGVPLVTPILGWLFSFWQRKTEYTADRAGLLACQDLPAALGALVKLAVGPRLAEQLNVDELVQQTREVAADTSARFAETLASHPFLLKRIEALIQFWHSEQYSRLIEETGAGYAGLAGQHDARRST